ncbi:DUF6802 family protein [Haloechinothrix salitolerans]|uniref:DUF6802 family protein n=1 Tax=Haloechinothrix salitolerans TaxID=926830 RepID=A0ABW2BUD0_9PSEU
MYVDESGGSDETVTSEDVTVTVDGQDYEVEKNADLDSDGHVDTAIVDNADNTRSAYIDEDGDGDADIYVEADERGNTIAEARFDEQAGEWVAIDPSAPDQATATAGPTDTHTSEDTSGTGKSMTADMPRGEVEVGPATIDTNEDGVNDTAVTKDDEGNTFYFTDVDSDGEADYALVVESDGTTVALKHTGDGRWEPVDTGATQTSGGNGGEPGEDTGSGIGEAIGDAAQESVSGITTNIEGVAKIDPYTGQWLSPN